MTDIVWGEPINEDRPSWLGEDEIVNVKWPNEGWSGIYNMPVRSLNWRDWKAFRLPADHFAYTAIDAGFEPWGGGDEAPADWSGRNEDVMYRDGHSIGRWPRSWRHVKSAGDIIGYRRRAEQPAGLTENEVRELVMGFDAVNRTIEALRAHGVIREPSEAERIAADTGIALADVERVLAAKGDK